MHESMKIIAVTAAMALAPAGVATAQQQPADGPEHGVEQQPTERPAERQQRARDDSSESTPDRRQASDDTDRRAQDRRASLDRSQRRRVQEELTQRGLYEGRIDGIHGPMTQRAIEEFQRAHGLDATGEVDRRTARAMGVDVFGERQPVSGTRDDQQANRQTQDRAQQDRAQQDGSANADSRARITDRGRHVRDIQRALQQRGFHDGAVDGLLGPNTERSIRAFQRDHDLPVTGEADDRTMRQLGVEATASQPRPDDRRTRNDMGSANDPSRDDASSDDERSMRMPTADPR